MSIGSGIAVAGIWCSCAAIAIADSTFSGLAIVFALLCTLFVTAEPSAEP